MTNTEQAEPSNHDSIDFGNEPLTFDEYQDLALDSAIYDEKFRILYPALKLAGEAGEVAEKVGKRLRDYDGDLDNLEFQQELAKELGDVLWYISALASDMGYSLAEIGDMNLAKLASRAARGVLGGSGDNR